MKKKQFSTIVVGNGIMAKQMLLDLSHIREDILNISSESFAPCASSRSTAINCLRGTKPGTSALGDLILDSYEVFEEFVQEYRPRGILKGKEIQAWQKEGTTHSKWLRRYGKCDEQTHFFPLKMSIGKSLCVHDTPAYFIDQEELSHWYQQKLKVTQVEDFVVSIRKLNPGFELLTHNGLRLTCEELFLCTSYMSKEFAHLCEDPKDQERLEKQKSVCGHYLAFALEEGGDYGLNLDNSFCLSLDFMRLVYKTSSNDFLLSFPDMSKESFLYDSKKLQKNYELFCQSFELDKMPSLNNWNLIQGIRSKGHQRMPFAKEVSPKLFIASGLYKNAYSFAYLFAKRLKNLAQGHETV